MGRVLLDTDILSFFFKGDDTVVINIEKYLQNNEIIEISIITYYEIYSGLLSKKAFKQLNIFNSFVEDNRVIPLTKESARISAELYSDLRHIGKTIDDIDLLIAGIAIENNFTLVTNNEKHFTRIPKLKVENWKKQK